MTVRRRLIQQANIQPGQRVLDVGCGTGLLTMMIKRSIPEASMTGLDGDEEALLESASVFLAGLIGVVISALAFGAWNIIHNSHYKEN